MAPAIGTPEVTRARRSSSEPAPPEAMSLAWGAARVRSTTFGLWTSGVPIRSEEHTSELQSHRDIVCRLLLEKKKTIYGYSSAVCITSSPKSRFVGFCDDVWACKAASNVVRRLGNVAHSL